MPTFRDNKDQIDWQLFELLEGNLNEEETAVLLDKINSDPDLKAEWECLQAARMPDPLLDYPVSSRFHKSTPFMGYAAIPRTMMRYAAVLLVFFLAVLFFIRRAEVSDPISMRTDTLQSFENGPVDPSNTRENSVEKVSGIDSAAPPAKTSAKPLPLSKPSQRLASTDTTRRTHGTVQDDNAANHLPVLAQKNLAGILSNHPHPPEIEAFATHLLPLELKNRESGKAFQVTGLRSLVDRGLQWAMQPLRYTDVHFVKSDQYSNPALKVTYAGKTYQAIARLELRIHED